jgi:glycosyltransferase involved in cell wall biosynthesis
LRYISRIYLVLKYFYFNLFLKTSEKENKILLIAEFTEFSGTHTYFLNLINYFSNTHDKITILTERKNSKVIHDLSEIYSLDVIYLPNNFTHFEYFSKIKGFQFLYIIDQLLPKILFIQKLILTEKIKEVWISPQYPGRFLFVSTVSIKTFYVVHAMLWANLDNVNKVFVKYYIFIKNLKIITVSNAAKDRIVDFWGNRIKKIIRVIPNYYEVVNNKQLPKAIDFQHAKIVLSIGTLDSNKRPHLFIEIAALSWAKYGENVKFLWLGEGKLLEDCKKVSLNYPNVYFLGVCENVESYYQISDIYVQLSGEESQGIAILGAMCHSLPCVISNCGGAIESVFHGNTGYVIHSTEASQYFSTLSYLLDNPEISSTMGEAGCEVWKNNFNKARWEKQMAMILNSSK